MPRKFYVIDHNTNRLPEAHRAIEHGANAIQPDIHYHTSDKRFYVYHYNPILTTGLEKYLEILSLRLTNDPSMNLALVSFDLKPPYDYKIGALYEVIRRYFSEVHPDVLIQTTGNNDKAHTLFMGAAGDQRPNELVGIDENAPIWDVESWFKPLGLRYSYAAGSSVFSAYDHIASVQAGLERRDQNNGLKMVYAWTVNSHENMKAFLDLEPAIDGIMTDDLKGLRELLMQDKYAEKFELAKRGDNPFV
jgi:glycerophosphoryl diester phosphodiesterase